MATVQRCCLQAFDDLNYILKTDQRYILQTTTPGTSAWSGISLLSAQHSLNSHKSITMASGGLAGDQGDPACQRQSSPITFSLLHSC